MVRRRNTHNHSPARVRQNRHGVSILPLPRYRNLLIATAVFGSVKQGIKPNIMTLSTLMLMVSIVFVTISYLFGRSGTKSGR